MHTLTLIDSNLFKDNKINVIKALRGLYGISLYDAKDIVETFTLDNREIQVEWAFIVNIGLQQQFISDLKHYGIALINNLTAGNRELVNQTKVIIKQAIDESKYEFAISLINTIKEFQ